jgi:hypothetical protein
VASRSWPVRGRTRLLTAAVSVISAVTAAVLVTTAQPASANPDDTGTKLFVKYATTSACTVYLNYPKDGVVGNGSPWTVPAGESVIWRYNVDSTWALISYPKRAHATFPWWGFTRRDCLGTSVEQADYPAGVAVPQRVLEGRSRQLSAGWRPVDFSVAPAPVVEHGRAVVHNATLRDPANFVIGNVPASWHVDLTDHTRSNGHWIEVYVPNAQRWGYVERDAVGL